MPFRDKDKHLTVGSLCPGSPLNTSQHCSKAHAQPQTTSEVNNLWPPMFLSHEARVPYSTERGSENLFFSPSQRAQGPVKNQLFHLYPGATFGGGQSAIF